MDTPLTIKHVPGIRNELCDFTSRNNCDARLGESPEELAKLAFERMDIHLDRAMDQVEIRYTFRWWDYVEEHPDLKGLKTGLHLHYDYTIFARLGSLLTREGIVVVPGQTLEMVSGWWHKVNGHRGPENLLHCFLTHFSTSLSSSQLMQVIESLPPCISCHCLNGATRLTALLWVHCRSFNWLKFCYMLALPTLICATVITIFWLSPVA